MATDYISEKDIDRTIPVRGEYNRSSILDEAENKVPQKSA